MDSMTSLLGLALRAGRLAVGEEPVGAACRAHKAYLLLLACDAADNTIRRAHQFTQAVKTITLPLPLDKTALGACLGRKSCAMVALTDVGLAASVAEKGVARGKSARSRRIFVRPRGLRPGERYPGPVGRPGQTAPQSDPGPEETSQPREAGEEKVIPAFQGPVRHRPQARAPSGHNGGGLFEF